jgi:hypothetical protein
MSTSTGDLRAILIDCIEKVKTGKMSGADAKAVAMLAGQITLSLQVEVNARRDDVLLGKQGLGALGLSNTGAPSGSVEEQGAQDHPREEIVDVLPIQRSPWPGAVTVHRLAD